MGGSFIYKNDKDIIQIKESIISLRELYRQQKKKYNEWKKNMTSILTNRQHLYFEYEAKKPPYPCLSILFNDDDITKDITDKIIGKIQKEIDEEK